MSKRCSVACDTDSGVLLCALELADAATIGEALVAARAVLGEVADWQSGAVGIYGQVRVRTDVPADGDRIELYRPLSRDPRAARRARVRRRSGLSRARGT